jgi:hypothetical protein
MEYQFRNETFLIAMQMSATGEGRFFISERQGRGKA